MPQPSHAQIRVCPGCDGFASAAVTLGGRDRNGNRRTITVHCRTCQGTGTLPVRQLVTATGSEVTA
ncbi:hypothetical protein OHT93_11685 [Streptomyces sp. NBC_00191]|uniref:hypothetical protein n=1 Tax=Streptomyces sp. NBC_00191 TaxID=2975674 RepID=UPI0032484C14